MQFLLSALLLVAAVSCSYGRKFCPYLWAPVCGADGMTYSNVCFLKTQKVDLLHTGPCNSRSKRGVSNDTDVYCTNYSSTEICNLKFTPLCANDGRTYPNRCFFCRAKSANSDLRVKHGGVCTPINEGEMCKPEYKNGTCPLGYHPICASDGKTYKNPCEYCHAYYEKKKNGNIMKIKREGKCDAEDAIECPKTVKNGDCSLEYFPICGSDGLVYGNKCMFCAAQERYLDEGIELYFERYGKCNV